MNYKETINFLFSSLPMYQRTGKAAYKANLDNTHALDRLLHHPHQNFKSVHVAGTNGKGSVSHMLTSVLMEAGYRTGLYTSPHLLDFRERIRIDGRKIPEKEVVDFVERIGEGIREIQPSFFEMTVAMAFDYFARNNVDIAVIETGMGGRLDSTNIITPELSVITSISMDHTEYLGNTLELIAAEKGGIIKQGVPVIAGQNSHSVCQVLADIADSRNAELILAGEKRTFSYETLSKDQQHTVFHFRNDDGNPEQIRTDLGGQYQAENISLLLSVVHELRQKGWDLPDHAIENGLALVNKNTAIRGRWEILGANPRIICDTAHNPAGVKSVTDQLRNIPHKKLHIVWGMVGDKPASEILKLLPADARYYFTQPSIPRAMPAAKLSGFAAMAGLQGDIYPTVEKAFEAARKAALAADTIFVGGSTFIVSDLLARQ